MKKELDIVEENELLFNIVVPLFNAEKYIEKCLLSIVNQSYKRFQVQVVDDCSGDGDCCPVSWIGDGFDDCSEQQYGCDLSCYDNDGGECGEELVSRSSSKNKNDNIISPVPRSGCFRIIKNGTTFRRIGKIINKCSLNV